MKPHFRPETAAIAGNPRPAIQIASSRIDHRLHSPEFFNGPVLLALSLFAANNLWLKFAYPGWLTGKLSDFLFCFFFPLYCSALIALITPWPARARIYIGAFLTLASFVAMKTMPSFSAEVSTILSYLSGLAGLGPSSNVVDNTDLIATPVIVASAFFGRRQNRTRDD